MKPVRRKPWTRWSPCRRRCALLVSPGLVLLGAVLGFAVVPVRADEVADAKALLVKANEAEDSEAGLALAREAIRTLANLDDSAARDALLEPAKQFATAMSLFNGRRQGEGLSRQERTQMVRQLESVPPDHPLYPRTCFHLGRYYYWLARENGRQEDSAKSKAYFDKVKDVFGQERLVGIYTGERLAWPTTYNTPAPGAPVWAVRQREALRRVLEVIHYWINERQADDGSLGCGWGDDVEILRFWPVAILAADDDLARLGMGRLVEGVWNSGAVNREQGFAARLTDVEHAAEPTADTQPMMLLYDYGAPRYVERNLQAVKLMADFWTGKNARGHRLFHASWLSATQMDVENGRDVCSPYCVRAAKAGHWLGWYNRDPVITKLFTEWMDTWLAAAQSTARGKPKGVLPASIRFADERFGGAGPSWYDSGLGKLYTFPAALGLLFEQLLTTHALSGDEKYLEPLFAAADLVIEYDGLDPKPTAPPGSRLWAAERMRASVVPALSKWRIMTGDPRYDAFLRRAGSPYLRYRLTGDVTPLVAACEDSIDSTRINRELVTTEVRWSDRVAVRGTDALLAMYTGHVGRRGYWPLHAVTWEGAGADFAALVRKADASTVEVLAYNFSSQPRTASMRLWRLAGPAAFRVRVFEGDQPTELAVQDWALHWRHRGDGAKVVLPPRQLVTIVIDRAKPGPLPAAAALPDPALQTGDFAVTHGPGNQRTLTVTVRNLTAVPVKGVKVTLTYLYSTGLSRVMSQGAMKGPLPGARDFAFGRGTVTMAAPNALGLYELAVQTENPELNPHNNRIRIVRHPDGSITPAP